MAIKTRETTGTGVTNKGAPLTNAEVDTNFIELVAVDATKLTAVDYELKVCHLKTNQSTAMVEGPSNEFTVNFNLESHNDSSFFSHSSGVITVLETGWHRVYANMVYQNATGSQRTTVRAFIKKNGTAIDSTTTFDYDRGSSYGEFSNNKIETLLYLTANDTLEIANYAENEDGNASIEADMCEFIVTRETSTGSTTNADTVDSLHAASFVRSDADDDVTGKLSFTNTSGGIDTDDDVFIRLGTGNDLRLSHNGSASRIQNYTGELQITNFNNDNDVRILSDDGSGGATDYFRADGSTGEAILYHYGTSALSTKNYGIEIQGDSTNGSGTIQLNCENNSHGVKIKGPPHSASANYTLTLPNDDGTSGQALTTDGSGVLSWTTVTSGSTLTIKDEGSALSTAATTLNFTGAGVVATGSGAEKTITISGGGGSGSSGVGEGKALVFANLFG